MSKQQIGNNEDDQRTVSRLTKQIMTVTDTIQDPTRQSAFKEPAAGITVTGLSLSLQGRNLLDNISFQLPAGSHLAITGPSGSGKTLLLNAIAGKRFHKGTVSFANDHSVITLVEQHYHFRTLSNTSDFYYQQRYNSFDNTDAATVAAELHAICSDTAQVQQLLSALQLAHKATSPLLHLSSGEHKRFQLVKALLVKADMLLLDEPFMGLDSNSRKGLNNILADLAANGTQLICVADAAELPSCINRVALLDKGKLISLTGRNALAHKNGFTDHAIPVFTTFPTAGNTNASHFEQAILMEDVTVKYGDKTILDHINWQVNKGERWLLKGHNGAGKSTLLSLICGDNPQTYANKVCLFGKRRGSGESIWDIKKNIGFISPELHWYFDRGISAYEVIGSGFFDTIGLFRKLSIQQQQVIEQWLDLFRLKISHVQNQPLSAISTGEQRLMLLIRALVKDPPLLLLDEPCQGLDAGHTKQFVELVDRLCTQLDKTLVYISHYDNEIPACIDKVLELKEGKQHIYSLNNTAAMAV